MSARMQTPVNQKRHSNVAVVRYTKHGKKLEIACYKNKVVAFREGSEVRLEEVIQIDRVFVAVDKGEFASLAYIRSCLGKDPDGNEFSEEAALKFVLEHGELQVSAAEREHQLEETFKSACTIAAQRCVHSVTNRPYSIGIIQEAAKRIGFSLGGSAKNVNNAKSMALRLIKELVAAQIIPIRRAATRIRLGLLSSTVDVSPLPADDTDTDENSSSSIQSSNHAHHATIHSDGGNEKGAIEAVRRFLGTIDAVVVGESSAFQHSSASLTGVTPELHGEGGGGASQAQDVHVNENGTGDQRHLLCNPGEFKVILIDIDPEQFRAVNEWCTEHGISVAVIDYAVADTSDGSAQDFVVMTDTCGSASMDHVPPPRPPLAPPHPIPSAGATASSGAKDTSGITKVQQHQHDDDDDNSNSQHQHTVTFNERELDTLSSELEAMRKEIDDQDTDRKKGKASKKKEKKPAGGDRPVGSSDGSGGEKQAKKTKKKEDDDEVEEAFEQDEEKEVKKVEYTLIDIGTEDDPITSLMDDDGETRDDLYLPGHGPDETKDDETEKLCAEIKAAFEQGLEVTVVVFDNVKIGAIRVNQDD